MVLLRQNPDKSISVRRLSDLQKEGILVDVREEAEYRSGHASGAINIPLSKLEQSLEKLPKDKPVYLMCRSGSRSRMALNRLQAAGFDNAVNVQGGIMAWQMAELPISKGNLPGVSL
jgi:rhodanese-related sulfurtransferase